MVKILKSPKGKLVLYLPQDVIGDMKLKENDEVNFYKGNGGAYVFVKTADIGKMIMGGAEPPLQQAPQPTGPEPSAEEIAVLKKIDTIRYENRTAESTSKILNESERKVLQRMLLSGIVGTFKGKYSISKHVYDTYLMRKKPIAPALQTPPPSSFNTYKPAIVAAAKVQQKQQDEGVAFLEKNGYIVLPTEAEASRVSLLLEQSIRRGLVLGTRAFNKKFYIVLRSYFDSNSAGILKKLRESNNYKVSDLSDELRIDEDGARAILYLLSENGDVSEKKRDVFTLA